MIPLRSLLFNIVMFSSGTVLSLYGRFLLGRAPTRIIDLGMTWARISLRALTTLCGIRINVIGQNFLPQSGPALIAAQHQSAFDTLVWLTLLPRPAYVLKQELLKLPLLGPLLIPSGFIAVDRNGGVAALRKMVADCRTAIAAGRQIVIFPEGTRVPAGERGTVQPGVVALAMALDLPVIPVATDSGLYWGRQAFTKYPGDLKIKIYPPLPRGTRRAEVIRRLTECYYMQGVDNSVSHVPPVL